MLKTAIGTYKEICKKEYHEQKSMLKYGSLWMLLCLSIYYFYLVIHMHKAKVEINRRIFREKEYFRRQYKEMQQQWNGIRKVRHDLSNLYVLEMAYLKAGQYQLLMDHYCKILGDLQMRKGMIITGNTGIDAILDYKTNAAEKKGIQITTQVCGSKIIAADPEDMNIILGNLLDNAVEAVREVPKKKKEITVVIKSDVTALLLQVSNPYIGKREKDRMGRYLTSKQNKRNHGIGLQRVKTIIEKYRGRMKIIDKNGEFTVQILLYM